MIGRVQGEVPIGSVMDKSKYLEGVEDSQENHFRQVLPEHLDILNHFIYDSD